ncbi:uncharacterized protein MYCFIDRAFT_190021 [Pseudocercospora fijiensis CIRAD86]|uniref:Aconitase/3-isopropylmalate dehydratase large subunit alpha/beta/alpha domain-containing protein n=1 Tax=Pseudocercospora fijiensis (strain CIRAD86) TaxID=383855 RepID=M2YS70_PSEFD|nr:uncharacterized protein MYCFIDRAFT_190021 [Pseudocercospora fijiensis CIRAD86]EME80585.1 hypothetical protein MYCFIDRAFT_190021 [Pseudocercospora fijiensis CIRAD86]
MIAITHDTFISRLQDILRSAPPSDVVGSIAWLASELNTNGYFAEEQTIRHVLDLCNADVELGGLGISDLPWSAVDAATLDRVVCLTEAWLAAMKSRESTRPLPKPLLDKPEGRRPMTLAAKILAHHALSVEDAHGVNVGDFLRVSVDWVIASELSWVGMKHSVTSLNMRPRAWRNDRFWLAGDHAVDPRIYEQKRVRDLMHGLEEARKDLKMTENQGSNYTILHTEFVRERAEPGMLVLGSDSHTCSAGAVSALAIGLGAADVMAALATGETWLKVPECIRIDFVGQPLWYVGGKDIVLDILRQLKRNTHAADRVVEFGGPGIAALSCDARFAISNMCTELGAITGIFEPDSIVQNFVKGRKASFYKSNSIYFTADTDAPYEEKFVIDLSQVEPYIALYPSPDQVEPVTSQLGMPFDGIFIGACTTTEEDLVLAALVLEAGLAMGLTMAPGKRVMVPGSLPIVHNLRKLGLLEIFTRCGWEQPAPACSLCLGIGADVAESGTRWLSSQNRNFKNRMGKGAIGHICSAATAAASSFSMTLTNPKDILEHVSEEKYLTYLARVTPTKRRIGKPVAENVTKPTYTEPLLCTDAGSVPAPPLETNGNGAAKQTLEKIESRIFRMGDYVDTDAIIPAAACINSPSDEDLGNHCFEFAHPDFRHAVRSGSAVVVAGKAFGCGSSREEAPRALKGLGVKCVIAKSLAYIFARNMPNIGMLAITITDEDFYRVAEDGESIEIDVEGRKVKIGSRSWPFSLGSTELHLINLGGLGMALKKHGNHLFAAIGPKNHGSTSGRGDEFGVATYDEFEW